MRLLIAILTLTLCSLAADSKLGAPLALKSQTPIADLSGKPTDYVGKQVQVKGKVTEVCQNMGCWMMLVDPANNAKVRIKVKDGEIVFPKEAVGKMAVAEGKFVEIKMTKEQAIERAKHEAEENKKPFDPASVTGPQTIYQIAGSGAVILN
jgi:NACalpha-BTF3-like transcription factor